MSQAELLLSIAGLILGTICLCMQLTSLVVPYWGSFKKNSEETHSTLKHHGHFGAWKICLDESWSAKNDKVSYVTLCQPGITNYAPPELITAAGILAVVNVVLLCQYIPFAVIHIIKHAKHDSDLMLKTKVVIIFKIIVTVLIAVLSVCVLGLFAGSKSLSRDYITDYEWGFYIIVVTLVFSFGLTGITEAEYFVHRRKHDREKRKRDPTGADAVTYGNPHFGIQRKIIGPKSNVVSNNPAKNGQVDHPASTQSSRSNTMSTVNPSSDSTYLETTFNGIVDHNTQQKTDPALDTGLSYSNQHFMNRSSPNDRGNARKNTQV